MSAHESHFLFGNLGQSRLAILSMLRPEDVIRHWEDEKRLTPLLPQRHLLTNELVVSLTSYGPRLPTLHLTLNSLLEQTITPDRIVVWIAEQELHLIPVESRNLEGKVEFRSCKDVKSYKKLIPAISAFPAAYIATADDDIYYHRRWLEQLVSDVKPDSTDVLCHIAYRFHFAADGLIAAYDEWTRDVQDVFCRESSTDLLQIGGGGVLYPPQSLYPDVLDCLLFQRLCPDADDLWFFAMCRLNGSRLRKIGPRLITVTWPGSQRCALWRNNMAVGNDVCIQNLIRHYGAQLFRANS